MQKEIVVFCLVALCLLTIIFDCYAQLPLTRRDGTVKSEIVSDSNDPEVIAVVKSFQNSIKEISGLEIPVVAKASEHSAIRFHIGLYPESESIRRRVEQTPFFKDSISQEGYMLQYDRSRIYLAARSVAGLRQAIRRFLTEYCKAELEKDDGKSDPVIKSRPDNYGIQISYILFTDDETRSNIRKNSGTDNNYVVKKTPSSIPLEDGQKFFDSKAWTNANILRVAYDINPKENKLSDGEFFRPKVELRILYDSDYVYLRYEVEDRYVQTVVSGRQANVSQDSCVEFFVRPKDAPHYFNFETNASAVMLLYRIRNINFGDILIIPPEDFDTVKRFSTLPEKVDPAIMENVTWKLGLAIPIKLFEKYTESFKADLSGQIWHANVIKCGYLTPNPHSLSWQVFHAVDYHQPEFFGEIHFE